MTNQVTIAVVGKRHVTVTRQQVSDVLFVLSKHGFDVCELDTDVIQDFVPMTEESILQEIFA